MGDTRWEIGLATGDVLVLLKNENPTLAAAFGFLRFGF
jgi:hypothetical protein